VKDEADDEADDDADEEDADKDADMDDEGDVKDAADAADADGEMDEDGYCTCNVFTCYALKFYDSRKIRAHTLKSGSCVCIGIVGSRGAQASAQGRNEVHGAQAQSQGEGTDRHVFPSPLLELAFSTWHSLR